MICFGAIFIVVGVFKLSRIGKDADESRIFEDRETEALVYRLIYGDDGRDSADSAGSLKTCISETDQRSSCPGRS